MKKIGKMLMILTVLALVNVFGTVSFAHDEGHGPQLADSGRYGGLMAAVVDMKDAKHGAKANLVYKAELVRLPEDQVRIYLYDKEMKPLELSKLQLTAKGSLAAKVKGKYQTIEFELKLDGTSFAGKAPKPAAKPFNIDVHFKERGRDLLTGFDNLD